jgi:hypothetical protein
LADEEPACIILSIQREETPGPYISDQSYHVGMLKNKNAMFVLHVFRAKLLIGVVIRIVIRIFVFVQMRHCGSSLLRRRQWIDKLKLDIKIDTANARNL